MPVDSESRTWRPQGLRIVATAALVSVIVLTVAVYIALGPELRTHFTLWQRISTVVMFVAAGVVWWALMRCSLRATDTQVVVTNGYRRYRYEWAQVVAIRFPQGAPWPTLDLDDGTSRSVVGVQASEGRRSREAVREFRALLDAHNATPRND